MPFTEFSTSCFRFTNIPVEVGGFADFVDVLAQKGQLLDLVYDGGLDDSLRAAGDAPAY